MTDAAPPRRRLPDRRRSWTQKVTISGKALYLSCGEYEDGSLGEIWLDYPRAGTAMRGMLHAFAVAVSINLQYGVPLGALLHSLRGQDFLPQGVVVGSPEVAGAKSLIDFVCRQLEAAYPSQVQGGNR